MQSARFPRWQNLRNHPRVISGSKYIQIELSSLPAFKVKSELYFYEYIDKRLEISIVADMCYSMLFRNTF